MNMTLIHEAAAGKMQAFVARCQVNILAWVAQCKDGIFFRVPVEMRIFPRRTCEGDTRFPLPGASREEGGWL